MPINSNSNNEKYLVLTELVLLLAFTLLLSICFHPINNVRTYNFAIVIWTLLIILGYLFGEFEPTISIYFGLNIRTQVIFVGTLIIYMILFFAFDSLPPINFVIWIIIWIYLNFLAPIIGFVARRIFPIPVVLVSDTNDKRNLLKWWGYDVRERIAKEQFPGWLKINSNSSGRINNYDLILIDSSDPNSENMIPQLWEKYFISFISIKSYHIIKYILGVHTQVISKYPGRGTQYRLKRLIDFFICLSALILSAPLFLFIIICIKLDSPGPVFYRHRRLGKNMKPFNLLKLRTMYQDADKRLEYILSTNLKLREEFDKTFKLKKDPRITRTGKIIRQLSIDEMPQILNVIKGNMTLVGPRPIVEKEIPYYQNYSLDLFRVLPGLTGLWQTSGRTETTYQKRVILDTQYVRTWSLLNDLKLLIKTIPTLVSQRGAY
jgi:lipopolysaccharide/colanic/teichoic acid biosynthesis glycosyltransferase